MEAKLLLLVGLKSLTHMKFLWPIWSWERFLVNKYLVGSYKGDQTFFEIYELFRVSFKSKPNLDLK
jgi:hypothetical protein